MRGDDVSAVQWVNRCGGGLRTDGPGCSWDCLVAWKSRAGGATSQNTSQDAKTRYVADGISRWSSEEVDNNVRKLIKYDAWKSQDIGTNGKEIFELSFARETAEQADGRAGVGTHDTKVKLLRKGKRRKRLLV